MKLLGIAPANDGIHKYKATFDNDGRTKTTKFGAKGYEDYTITHDKEQRARYRARHAKDLKGDPTKAGYLSYHILWGSSPSMSANLNSYKNKFNL